MDVHTAVDLSSIEIKDVLASVFLLCTEVESLMMKHGNVQGTLKMQDRKKKKDNDYYAGNVVNVYLNIDCKGRKPLICR